MGLDMYLEAHRYVSGYEHSPKEEQAQYAALLAFGEARSFVDPETPHARVRVTAAYWRKANAIHGWFVREVQGGVDDCRAYDVDREQLQALSGLCSVVLADPGCADELLPTAEGFFFGATDYGEWYRTDLNYTVLQLTRALTAPKGWYFQYRASW